MYSNEVLGPYWVGLCKYIRKGWESIWRQVQIVALEDVQVKFWYDKWCGERSLQDIFVAIFELA